MLVQGCSTVVQTESVETWSFSAIKVSFALLCHPLALVDVAARGTPGARFIQQRGCLQTLQPLNMTAAKSPVIMQRTKLSSVNKGKTTV